MVGLLGVTKGSGVYAQFILGAVVHNYHTFSSPPMVGLLGVTKGSGVYAQFILGAVVHNYHTIIILWDVRQVGSLQCGTHKDTMESYIFPKQRLLARVYHGRMPHTRACK